MLLSWQVSIPLLHHLHSLLLHLFVSFLFFLFPSLIFRRFFFPSFHFHHQAFYLKQGLYCSRKFLVQMLAINSYSCKIKKLHVLFQKFSGNIVIIIVIIGTRRITVTVISPKAVITFIVIIRYFLGFRSF